VLFDPVNMLDLDNVDHREELFQEALELLGKDIAMVHLKDFVRVNEDYGLKSVGAGTGEMDYSGIMKYLKKEKPFIFATLENTNPENAASCRQAMQDAYDRA
jgi:L-ribulose-5-phosphate 3-epimerase UlaE